MQSSLCDRSVSIDSGGHRQRVLRRRDALVEAHIDLVPPIASRIHARLPPSFQLDDLIGAGNWGLLRAATRFRPAQHGGTPFSAFARPRIRGAILDSIRRGAWIEATRPQLSPDYDVCYIDAFANRTIDAIDEELVAEKDHYGRLRKRLAVAITRLTARERAVLGAYYADNCRNIASAGRILGLTVSQVTAEHDAAVAKLRARLAS